MRIFIVKVSRGDGYSNNSEEPVAAFFDEDEAETHATRLNEKGGNYEYHSVQSCPLVCCGCVRGGTDAG